MKNHSAYEKKDSCNDQAGKQFEVMI